MVIFSGYMDSITIYIDIYLWVLIVSVLTVVYLRHSIYQVRVATHSCLTDHTKVAGNQRHTCVYKKQNS